VRYQAATSMRWSQDLTHSLSLRVKAALGIPKSALIMSGVSSLRDCFRQALSQGRGVNRQLNRFQEARPSAVTWVMPMPNGDNARYMHRAASATWQGDIPLH
jgi:hypothetical protein